MKVNPSAFSHCPLLVNLKLAAVLSFDDHLMIDDIMIGCKRLQQVYPCESDNNDDCKNKKHPTTTSDNLENNHIVQHLNHRWDDLPIHRLSYYQAHHSTQQTLGAMQERMEQDARTNGTKYEWTKEFSVFIV